MSELTSATVPPMGGDDHVTGEGIEAIVYADFGCPYCAAGWARLRELPLRL
jgi:protein-disulfide isomerase